MALSRDLLGVARKLLNLDPGRPKQASLRRAISTAYYSAFHFLIEESTAEIVGGAAHWARVRAVVARKYTHTTMNSVCKKIAMGNWPAPIPEHFAPLPTIPPKLRDVAQSFVALQEARHAADYHLTKRYSRADANILVERAAQLPADWQVVASGEAKQLFLRLLVLGKERD